MKRFLSMGLLLVVFLFCFSLASKIVVAEEPDKVFWTIRKLVDKQPFNEYGNRSLEVSKIVKGETVKLAVIYVPPGGDKPEQILAVRYNEKTGELMTVGYFYADKTYFEAVPTPWGFVSAPLEKEEAVKRAAQFLTDLKQLQIAI